MWVYPSFNFIRLYVRFSAFTLGWLWALMFSSISWFWFQSPHAFLGIWNPTCHESLPNSNQMPAPSSYSFYQISFYKWRTCLRVSQSERFQWFAPASHHYCNDLKHSTASHWGHVWDFNILHFPIFLYGRWWAFSQLLTSQNPVWALSHKCASDKHLKYSLSSFIFCPRSSSWNF